LKTPWKAESSQSTQMVSLPSWKFWILIGRKQSWDARLTNHMQGRRLKAYTEREVCTVKYQTVVFYYGPSDEGAKSMQKTEVWYFTVQTEQARSIIGLLYGWTESVSICFSRELNRLSSVSLGNNIR
jgi:hypothetical protein